MGNVKCLEEMVLEENVSPTKPSKRSKFAPQNKPEAGEHPMFQRLALIPQNVSENTLTIAEKITGVYLHLLETHFLQPYHNQKFSVHVRGIKKGIFKGG